MSHGVAASQIGGCQAAPASTLTYALITPARNEAQFIELTLRSVIAQTQLPTRWVIVSDGSTDGTDEIVRHYAERHPWIELLRMPERAERHFAGKVHAFNAGLAVLAAVPCDVIGNLDADLSFDSEHFAFLMKRFADNPALGVASTALTENGLMKYDFHFASTEHVSGACQMFRRDCFQQIGGYTPIPLGGIDLAAVLGARMKGWQTRTFVERTMAHHRAMGTAQRNIYGAAFRGGYGDYCLGMHPMWEVLRCLRSTAQWPLVLGPLRLAGFVWAVVARAQWLVSEEMVRFRRHEQMERLAAIWRLWNVGSR